MSENVDKNKDYEIILKMSHLFILVSNYEKVGMRRSEERLGRSSEAGGVTETRITVDWMMEVGWGGCGCDSATVHKQGIVPACRW